MTETATRFRQFEPNPAGRDYVVGDIHGCFALLDSLLMHISFDPASDRLFSVGDLMDRGPDSEQAPQWLNEPWFHAIRGNHEVMLLDAVHIDEHGVHATPEAGLWLANGGDWFFQLANERQAAIRALVMTLPWAIEVDMRDGGTAALVHADVLDNSWPATKAALRSREDDDDAQERLLPLVWSRRRATAAARPAVLRRAGHAAVDGVDMICFGHTPIKRPLSVANTRWLDTGAVFGGRLSIAELKPEGEVWSLADGMAAPATGWHGR